MPEVNTRRATNDEVREQLANLSREPFVDTLAFILECKPDKESVLAFAQAHPDRWANALVSLAKLSGYHDKLEVENNINLRILHLGDAELIEEMNKIKCEIIDLAVEEQGDDLAIEAGQPEALKPPRQDD